jgi:hypothetical protein
MADFIQGIALPGQPMTMATTLAPDAMATRQSIIMPDQHAQRLHTFFHTHYTQEAPPGPWASHQLLSALYDAPLLDGWMPRRWITGQADIRTLRPWQPYSLSRDDIFGINIFITLDTPERCLTIARPQGPLALIQPQALYDGFRPTAFHTLDLTDAATRTADTTPRPPPEPSARPRFHPARLGTAATALKRQRRDDA